jgi:predicted transcriptional regulator
VDVIVPIEISPEDLAALDTLAAKSNITRNDVITKALIAAASSYS